MPYKVLSVVGTRPSCMKLAAICEAVNEYNHAPANHEIEHVLVHTGRHGDLKVSEFFFNDIDLPRPDYFLGIEPGSQASETAMIMERFEAVLVAEKPSVVLVAGDTNAAVACALVTKKTVCSNNHAAVNFIPKLAHVEAGLRSLDRMMPEEINRIVTDAISDYLFTTEESANQHLLREGVALEKVHFVGNVMIDTMLRHLGKAKESTILSDLQLCAGRDVKPYAILTLDKPSNVNNPQTLAGLLQAFAEVSQRMPVIFPAHPNTLKQIQEADLGDYFIDHFMDGPEPWDSRVRIRLVPPLGYLDFLHLMSNAKVTLTDSSGIQEETTVLGIPCVTLRDRTERTVTLIHGTNVLAGADPQKIVLEFFRALQGERKTRPAPTYWDGNAARRIIQILADDVAQFPRTITPQSETPRYEVDGLLNSPRQ